MKTKDLNILIIDDKGEVHTIVNRNKRLEQYFFNKTTIIVVFCLLTCFTYFNIWPTSFFMYNIIHSSSSCLVNKRF
jgi:hypothetical protein